VECHVGSDPEAAIAVREVTPMGRVLSLIAVLVSGWAAAILLLHYFLKLSFGDVTHDPGRTVRSIVELTGLVLVAATPAVAAWLAAKYGWTATAWVFGVLAAGLAGILGLWLIGMMIES
jgi:hypothetical protein